MAILEDRIEQPESVRGFFAGVFENASGETLPFRLLHPKSTDATCEFPLVLFLHGLGESGSDNRKQLDICVRAFERAQNAFPSFVLAPQCPIKKQDEPWGWADFHPQDLMKNNSRSVEIGKHLRLTLELLASLKNQFPIDMRRLYVTGISMGGFGTWELIGRRPGMFAAAVPICGGGDLRFARALAQTPVWAFHGGQDKTVVPEFSRRTVAAIREVGGNCRYTEFPQVAHNSWDAAFATRELIPWMFSQKHQGCFINRLRAT